CAGPPGPALHSPNQLLANTGEAGQGAGRRPGGLPHNLCRCPEVGKLCGIKLSACSTGTGRRMSKVRMPAVGATTRALLLRAVDDALSQVIPNLGVVALHFVVGGFQQL